MNDPFNILIFSKDYNQGVIIQDYIKAIGYNSQVFDLFLQVEFEFSENISPDLFLALGLVTALYCFNPGL